MHTEAARAYKTLEEKPTCMPTLIRPPLLTAAYRVTADGVGHPFCSCIAAYMVLQHWKAQCCRGSLPIQASTGTALHFPILLDGDGPPGAGCILSGVPYYAQHFGCEAAVLKHNRWLDQVLDCGLHADACADQAREACCLQRHVGCARAFLPGLSVAVIKCTDRPRLCPVLCWVGTCCSTAGPRTAIHGCFSQKCLPSTLLMMFINKKSRIQVYLDVQACMIRAHSPNKASPTHTTLSPPPAAATVRRLLPGAAAGLAHRDELNEPAAARLLPCTCILHPRRQL